jgi:hypothetical protein
MLSPPHQGSPNHLKWLWIYTAGHALYPVPALIRPDIINLLSGKYPTQLEISFFSGSFWFRPDRKTPYPVHL